MGVFVLSLLGMVISIASNLSIPLLLKKVVDTLSTHGENTSLILLSYGAIWMVSQVSNHARILLTYKVEQRITYALGIKALSHILQLSHSFFLNQKPGSLTNIIRRSQRDVPNILLGLFFHVIPTVIEFLCVVALIYSLYPPIYSALMVITLVAFFLFTTLSMRSALKDREHANEVDQDVDGIVTDWLSNYEAIKVFGKHDLAIHHCNQGLKKRESTEVSFMTKYNLSQIGQAVILGIGLSSLTYLVGRGVTTGSLSVGDFVLFNGYILQFIIPVSMLGMVTQNIKKAIVDMKGVIDVLLTKSEIVDPTHPHILPGDRFNIEFQNVAFKYKDRHIINDMSFKINAGETVLIVGPTGAGKSTIAKLLLRLYDPTDGQVLINETNLKNISLDSLYQTIGWVPQESHLMNDTIRNNLLFANPDATLKDLNSALKKAHLLHFIQDLPQGLDTVVGDRGLKLSGGEKQRLSIARLFLKQPRVCIFDESTSSVDKETDFIIQNNIETYLPNMTKIIIAHRPYLANKVDQIINLGDNPSLIAGNTQAT